MLNWFQGSLTRKIGGLSVVLLSFLFLVILYSVITLQRIDGELRELDELDVPLSESMAELEVLQLKQHLFLEQLALACRGGPTPSVTEFRQHKAQLHALLGQVEKTLTAALRQHRVRLDLHTHQAALASIERLLPLSEALEQTLMLHLQDQQMTAAEWQAFEPRAQGLDAGLERLLAQLDSLTLSVSRYSEQHERQFMFVNAGLGLAGLFIGIYLTVYIIEVFRRRIGRIQGEIDSLHHSLASGEPLPVMTHPVRRAPDELAELEQDLRQMMQQLSKEICNRQQVELSLLELATRDKLTGAFNRHKWDEQLKVELALGARGGQFSLILLDVDHFKQINDRHGHDVGDRVLQQLVARLQQRLRASDMLFRLGGEEFAILLRQQSLAAAGQLAESLRQQVEQPDEAGLPAYRISLGVSDYRLGDNQEGLFRRADQALYLAKQQGRNRVVLSSAADQ